MCGRFSDVLSWQQLHDLYEIVGDAQTGHNLLGRQNIAPTQDVLFCVQSEDGREFAIGRWWLVPSWAKEVGKYPTFNARGETAASKASFRSAFKSRRCLIPAEGYYEWTKAEDGGRDPHFIHLEGEPLSFAGLWESHPEFGLSCTIVTLPAAPGIAHLHNRMPVVLSPDAWSGWLDPANDAKAASALLENNRGSDLVSYRVSRKVNKSSYHGDDCREPI
ncbi:SOS response-associated peptidase [Cucumibacter marinus]|uniref:SOS response-associated peptidase n=1 Tax=Cucumibacter marinus TaxID=1121252 RepID=UPI0004025D34|nr:SOS response-associated peptidase [Cucumibacter marinus]